MYASVLPRKKVESEFSCAEEFDFPSSLFMSGDAVDRLKLTAAEVRRFKVTTEGFEVLRRSGKSVDCSEDCEDCKDSGTVKKTSCKTAVH